MTAGVQDDMATRIPVSCDGVKTHVFMDDSTELRGGRAKVTLLYLCHNFFGCKQLRVL